MSNEHATTEPTKPAERLLLAQLLEDMAPLLLALAAYGPDPLLERVDHVRSAGNCMARNAAKDAVEAQRWLATVAEAQGRLDARKAQG